MYDLNRESTVRIRKEVNIITSNLGSFEIIDSLRNLGNCINNN